ncbi:TraR/DksA family transcriptional regulator [Cnuibacter sp. UC19_7]|uniref:TraR/DksA family transcriptional regulator n=1 Tax=Cnuibacter sp. UC19_7 TaxID=3350166 RepID=UPI003672141E
MESLLADRRVTSDDDEHDPDGAPLSGEWARLRAQLDAADARLADIDAALLRVDDGTYGLCATCGHPIPLERLEVRPTATQCVPCAPRR